jgi:hypothetical protein
MCVNDYGIKQEVISTWNPQANAIVERAHQTLVPNMYLIELSSST